jgi:drug/metabolite transporter (DMT)-like permease|tara:strand:- start:194 stop:355 length:162 start_codon:yes stop_codon:yes gene_type:complete
MKIEWSEASTKRGIIWVVTAVVGAVFIFLGKPIDQLLLLAGGVAGGLGVILKD